MTKKIKVSKAAKEFDYGDIPNPYRDKGKTGLKGNVKLLNPKKKKEYDALKKQLKQADIEYQMFDKSAKSDSFIFNFLRIDGSISLLVFSVISLLLVLLG